VLAPKRVSDIVVFMQNTTNITRQLWKKLYRKLQIWARLKKPYGTKFTDCEILNVYLWAVLNDRPVSWAANKSNWPYYWQRKLRLPDDSTVSRRMKTESVQELFKKLVQLPKS